MTFFLSFAVVCEIVIIAEAISSKIVGGFSCRPTDYPYLVSLRTINRKYFCGGSLVNKRHVLTAGHCCDYSLRKEQIRVYAGVSENRNFIQVSRARKRFIHPVSDVCVLRLSSSIYETSHTAFVKLATAEEFERLMATHSCDECITMGFGYQNIKDIISRKNNVTYNPQLQCVYQKVLNDCWYAVDTLCVIGSHNPTQDACHGDSGGPLICKGIQVGIVSAGHGCGLGIPSYYTKVDYVYSYIKTISIGNTCNSINKFVLLLLYLNILVNSL